MKLRLLATDPDPVLLDIYRAYFPNFGFEVATAIDGVQCLELLLDFSPDALVLSLDLLWGGADGVLAVVRDEEWIRPIPVVLTVGANTRSKAVKYLLPPVVKLLEKPFRLRDLQAIVEAALHARADRLIGRVTAATAFESDDTRLVPDQEALTTHIYRPESPRV